MDNTTASIKRQLKQLEELYQAGVLPQNQFLESKAGLERKLLDWVMKEPIDTLPEPAPASIKKTSLFLNLSIFLAIVMIAFGGYWWTGSPGQTHAVSSTFVAPVEDDAGKSAPHATNSEQIEAMVERLAQRLKSNPEDAEGWSMLARSYSVLGRHAESLKPYEKAIALRKDDATLQSDYAKSLAIAKNKPKPQLKP